MPNAILGNILLPRKDPTKPLQLEEHSVIIQLILITLLVNYESN